MVARGTVNPQVAGSNPARGAVCEIRPQKGRILLYLCIFKVISIVWNLNFENVKLSVMLGPNTLLEKEN